MDAAYRTYRVSSLERLSVALRQPDKIELALLDELCEGLDRFFDGDLWIHPSTFEEVELFETSKVVVDVLDASAKVFWASPSH